MLVQFTVGNFLSFYDRRTLNLEAKGISELKKNVISYNREKIVRSAVIYGANSSGKSNLIRALDRMREVVIRSVRLNDSDDLDYSPFLLSTESEKEPTYFEAVFWKEDIRYRYGFEYNEKNIVNEWLFSGKTKKNEKPFFIRTEDGIGVADKFEEGIGKEESTNDNRLFISLVAQLGGKISKKVLEFFKDLNVLSGLDHNDYNGFTLRMLHENLDGCNESLALFQKLNLGFKNVTTIETVFNPSELPEVLPEKIRSKLIKELTGKTQVTMKTVHNKFDKKRNIVDQVFFDKSDNESEGTNKIIDLSGPIFDTLISGKVLIIDELDAKLHALITINIVEIFNNPETNPNNAQLIFATHDTNLLGEDLFRRDQIWFTEKDDFEQTDLYSLYDFNLPDGGKVRNDSNIERNYIRGRYGAIPYINN
ncbi:AAA family ATPase [Flavobacterium sp. UBA4197]|uniref:AAA family ATPase n=1 Tax=Flavobacterium sp. UBA4197 TaxID=1946546 RepID=UPI00257B9B73|nr:ATP-binding protein [Flavobacterium sp. UBA4197]